MSNRRRPRNPDRDPARNPARDPARGPLQPPAGAYVARGEADLVAMVPLVLGFHPRESVVVLTFGARAFHARVDLPALEPMLDGAGEEVADMLVHACVTNGADRAAVVIHTDDHDRARRQGELLVKGLHGAGLDVVDVLRVHDGRWFEPLRGDLTGTPYALDTHPFTARSVYDGHVVHLDRDALAATLVGGDDDERERLSRAAALRGPLLGRGVAVTTLRAEARWVRERVGRAVVRVRATGDPGIDTTDAARLMVAVVRGDLRDAAWIDLAREVADDHVGVWRDLVRRSPTELLPSVAALLALAAYLSGDGALAWMALDRVAATDPGHTLGRLVADALTAAVPPSAWPPPDVDLVALLREEQPWSGG